MQKYLKYFLSIGFLILSLTSQLFAHTVLENTTYSTLLGDDQLSHSSIDDAHLSNSVVNADFSRLLGKDNLQLFFELIEDDKFDEDIVVCKFSKLNNHHFYTYYLSALGENLEKQTHVFPDYSNTKITTNSWYILFQVFRI